MYWEKVDSVASLKSLRLSELNAYAAEVREHIIATVEKNGGHLSSNLGSVELTIGLHYVFDCPNDKIVFDVGHQAYTHKIITGRRDRFDTLRISGGLSGFPKMSESDCDAFTVGHSSTSLSVALGLARARELRGDDCRVVAVIGDGALTGGLANEAINDIGASGVPMLIVLNDNTMSISRNVGAISKYLARLRLSKRYSRFKSAVKKGVSAMPFFGRKLMRFLDKTKDSVKSALLVNKMFENYGIQYYGPFDGHNIAEMVDIFRQVKHEKRPVLVHVITNKGKGLYEAERDPSRFHGLSSEQEKQTKSIGFSQLVGNKLIELAERDPRVVAITAAMADGTGLKAFAARYPTRCFDVGIAEEHAVTMAAGLAAGKMKPYFAVYSTFLQRGFDQVLHDVCINDLPVTLLIDRAGVCGADGVTHQGVFDLSYLNVLPNMTVLSPRDGEELLAMLEFSLTYEHPLAIRYPKSFTTVYGAEPFALDWPTVRAGKDAVILAVGNRMLDVAMQTKATVVNARCVKPLDTALLDTLNRPGQLLITLEDNVRAGGFGESVLAYLNRVGMHCSVEVLAHETKFIEDMSVDGALQASGLTAEHINEVIAQFRNKK